MSRNESILVEGDNETQSNSLMETTKFGLTMGSVISRNVSPHYTLKTRKGSLDVRT